MISYETLARQGYQEFKAVFERGTGTTISDWEKAPGAIKDAWIAAAKKLHENLTSVH